MAALNGFKRPRFNAAPIRTKKIGTKASASGLSLSSICAWCSVRANTSQAAKAPTSGAMCNNSAISPSSNASVRAAMMRHPLGFEPDVEQQQHHPDLSQQRQGLRPFRPAQDAATQEDPGEQLAEHRRLADTGGQLPHHSRADVDGDQA